MEKQPYILLVDDNLTTINLNKLLIQKVDSSAELLTANDGKTALDILSDCMQNGRRFPDLIFVDLKMPVMDGLEFFQKYKQNFSSQSPQTKVVMLTTSLNSTDFNQAAEAGIEHYLNKPLTTSKIKEIFA